MNPSRVAAALVVSSLLALGACSSSNNSPATTGNSDGGSSGGSGSGSSSGSTGGRTNVTCAQAALAVNGGTITSATSWGDTPTAFQIVPTGGTFCGTDVTGDGGGLTGQFTIILSSLEGADLLNAYSAAATAAGCTLTQSGEGLGYTCTNGGIGTITASNDDNFLFLGYSSSF